VPNYLAFDTETWRITPGRLAPRIVCLSWARSTDNTSGLVAGKDAVAFIRPYLEDAGWHLIGHNIAFDWGVLCAADHALLELVFAAYAAGRIHDTSMREKLIKLAVGEMSTDFSTGKVTKFSMEACFMRRFHVDLSADKGEDAWRMRYHELDGVPLERWPEEASRYAIEDAERTMRLFLDQASDDSPVVDRDTGTVTNEAEQVAAAWGLHLAGTWGIRTDPAAVVKLSHELDKQAHGFRSTLLKYGILRPDGTKDMKLIRGLVEECLGDAAPRTEKGAISTDRECLMRTGHEGLVALAEAGAVEKLRTTYVPVLLKGTELPINPRWNPLVESGRTSCGDPNLQNLPRKGGVRECFVPRPGRLFASADYSTLELCALAQVCLDKIGWSNMAEAIRAGQDLHVQMAATLLGISYEEAIARHKQKDPQVKEMRQLSKAANFGLPGGLGAPTFIAYAWATYGVKLADDPAEAEERGRQIKAQWLETWPEMRKYFADVGEQLALRDSFDLTQVRSGRVRGGVGYTDGCNSYFQGLAADGAKASLFLLQQESYTGRSELWKGEGLSPLYGCRMVAFIHDEFILEVPEDIQLARAATQRMVDVMVQGMALYIPDVPIKAEPTLMDRWYKEAEAVYDADGNLEVWHPKP